jgi:cellulose synthase/poly-beta-1,6-N-acetylglucosamine synthase-like glycosyltransferase
LIINSTSLFIIFSAFSLFYFVVLAAIYYGLRQLRIITGDSKPFVSIVIAARHEALRISHCLNSLAKLHYPENRYEVIIVDDGSVDNTSEIIEQFCTTRSQWQLIRIVEKSRVLHGKKNALMQGVDRAKGEIIFTTDADCIVPPDWLDKMVQYFQPDVSMVLGYSPLAESRGFLYHILAFDNLFSVIVSAAPVKLGHPFNSVGRNLAYRKKAYQQAGGFMALKQFRSGDDIHLTQKFRRLKNGRIDFCAHPDTFVHTLPPATLSEIFHQQLRKNSKTIKLGWPSLSFLFLIFIYYLLLLLLPVLFPQLVYGWLALVGIKLVLEYIILCRAAYIFDQKRLIRIIPVMQILYPFYLIVFNFLGMFQKYNWKN